MNKRLALSLSIFVLVLGVWATSTLAQATATPGDGAETPTVVSENGFDILVGRWVRPDGGYRIIIQGADSDGGLEAAYQNPNPLPFAKAEASRDGNTIKVFLELRASGYDGSTYNLIYDPQRDILTGVYYQAVAQQRFDIYFERIE
jgi:hypothetical protein